MGDASVDHGPGDEASLLAFYAAVPSAEEMDLAEEATRQQRLTEATLFTGPGEAPPPAEADQDQEEAEGGDEPTPLTDGQARGVLEQLLGAEPVEDEDEP